VLVVDCNGSREGVDGRVGNIGRDERGWVKAAGLVILVGSSGRVRVDVGARKGVFCIGVAWSLVRDAERGVFEGELEGGSPKIAIARAIAALLTDGAALPVPVWKPVVKLDCDGGDDEATPAVSASPNIRVTVSWASHDIAGAIAPVPVVNGEVLGC
jgi:hypothetical protein